MRYLVFALLLSACSDESTPAVGNKTTNNATTSTNSATNTSTNTATNNVVDMGNDTASDAGQDAAADVSMDSGVDAAVDIENDVSVVLASGDCSVDADCESGECVSVNGDATGWHTCRVLPTDPIGCEMTGGLGDPECCAATDCTAQAGGACVETPIFYCGGAAPQYAFTCLYDECGPNLACADGLTCQPAGIFGEPVARCVAATCVSANDCVDGTNGECLPFLSPCNSRFIGTHCAYDESPCRVDADCSGGANQQYCRPDGDTTACDTFFPFP